MKVPCFNGTSQYSNSRGLGYRSLKVIKMTTNNFKTLHVWNTKFSADSVEWCPISPYKNFFACGTYFLNESSSENVEMEKKETQRTGNITVFRVIKDSLEAKHTVDCAAVLDMKWSPNKVNGNIALAVANAAGEISLFYFEEGLLNFIAKCVLKKESGDFLILSLDWIKTDSPDLICSSDSRGNVTLIKISCDSLQVLKKWKAHSLEAWIVCFDSFSSNNIYSGGDEAEMKVWDYRSEDVLRIVSSKKHKAGVTALNSNVYKEYNLVSGSYDETILFWDSRNWETPKERVVASGGIWRLKWEPRNTSRLLLAACIYGGFQIYDTNFYSVVGEYREHESLAYGADWCFLDTDELKSLLNCEENALIATCSFYDHKLCVSLWNESVDTCSI